MIAKMIFDILENTKANIKKHQITNNQDVRKHKTFIANFSKKMQQEINQLRLFLKNNFYTSSSIVRMDAKSQRVIEELFALFANNYKLMKLKRNFTDFSTLLHNSGHI